MPANTGASFPVGIMSSLTHLSQRVSITRATQVPGAKCLLRAAALRNFILQLAYARDSQNYA